MNRSIPPLVLALCCASHAQSPYERDLTEIQVQRDKAIVSALEPINRRYLESLEQLLRRATQGNDPDAANKIKLALTEAGVTPPKQVADSLIGKWIFRSDAWSGTREFKADG